MIITHFSHLYITKPNLQPYATPKKNAHTNKGFTCSQTNKNYNIVLHRCLQYNHPLIIVIGLIYSITINPWIIYIHRLIMLHYIYKIQLNA